MEGCVLDAGRIDARHSGVGSERTQMELLDRYHDGAEVVPIPKSQAEGTEGRRSRREFDIHARIR